MTGIQRPGRDQATVYSRRSSTSSAKLPGLVPSSLCIAHSTLTPSDDPGCVILRTHGFVWMVMSVCAIVNLKNGPAGSVSDLWDLHEEIGLDDFKRHVLTVCVVGCLAIPFGLMALFSRPAGTDSWVTILVLALYGTAFLVLAASRRGTEIGGAALIVCLLGLSTACLWLGPLDWAVGLLPLLVLFASSLFGLGGGILTAALVTIDLVLVSDSGLWASDLNLDLIVGMTWANAVVAWLASEPVRLALNWSWMQYLRAELEADRARRQHSELASLVKSLNLTQDRLERLNQELDRARRAADEARRLKTEFAASISHELRTPLNLIIGFSELMSADIDGYSDGHWSTYQRDVDTIYRNARHLSSLIDDILDLAQIDAARMALVREATSLASLAREASRIVESLFDRKGLYLRADLPDDLPPVSIDRARIREVLINLISNAARFTEKGGVEVRAWQEDHQVVVSVTDTGPGIAPADLPRVFDEFRQVGSGDGHRIGHSGLGLTISKRLIELHGGSMWAESQPGAGSAFFFTVPLCKTVVSVPLRREWETWARASEEAVPPREVVIAYDTDPEPAHLLQRYLDGYEVVTANSLAEVRRIRMERVACAVVLTGPTDGATGAEAQQLRSQLGDTPVLLCPLPGRRRLARELGVVDYLVKPILREQVAQLIQRVGPSMHDVLVVDDDPDLVDLLSRMLISTMPSLTVRASYSGAEGLAAVREKRPDLLLLDLLMADEDGYALIRELRDDESLRDLSVVIVTARGRQDEMITAGMLGITRGNGLTVAEVMRLLNANLAALRGTMSSNAPALPEGLPG